MAPRLVLAGALGLGSLVVVRLVAGPLVRVTLPESAHGGRPFPANAPRTSVDSLGAAVQTRDPFRLTHRPAATAYDPLRLTEQLAPPPARPVLQLAGIIWEGGRDPTAVIEGFPGIEGPRVVKAGDVLAGLRVRRIAREYVRIDGMDTAWTLTVREPWH